jgi:hypothetical protein
MIRWREGEKVIMSSRTVTRKRVLIWAFVKLFLTLYDSANRRARGFLGSAARIIYIYSAGHREAMNDHVP